MSFQGELNSFTKSGDSMQSTTIARTSASACTFAAFSALVAAAVNAGVAYAGSIHGVTLAAGDSITYVRSYDSDSGWADINDCDITVRSSQGRVLFHTLLNLNETPVDCGGISRSGAALFVYDANSDTTSDGDLPKHSCTRHTTDGTGAWANPTPVETARCGH